MNLVVEVSGTFPDNHSRGLQEFSIKGDAPVVAEILRTLSGGPLPAHPQSVVATLKLNGVGPGSMDIRAYPIGLPESGAQVTLRQAQRIGERLVEALGITITDKPLGPIE